MTVIPPISQSQNRTSNIDPSGLSWLYYVAIVVGVVCITVCLICICCHLRKRNNRPQESTRSNVVPRFIETSGATYHNQRGAEYNVDTRPQQTFTFSIPMVRALRQPVSTDSDSIDEIVNDRSLSNQPPPSYYEVQAQGKDLPSYTETIQENRLQESVETINAAGPSEVTVAQEQMQLQKTATIKGFTSYGVL